MAGPNEKAAAGGGGGERRKYPIHMEDYELYEEIGQGVSAIVYRALCKPLDEIVAVKVVDFERTNSDLNNIVREAQTMILIDHPNVVKAHCSFAKDQTLWVVMPYMAGGSCLHIMKSVHPTGFEEPIIATILREVLKGLEYLHHHGSIHRDVKAGNILVDSRGGIKLGDFGVSACLFDSGDRQRARNTFVGTPCWMAPEVMEQLHGYDFRADIWSFGITALELAHGHAPFSKYPPMKVLLMTLQNAPPGLDYERDKKFTRNFKQMVAMCLVKDPSKRPSAKKLLKQPFFKQARSTDFIARKLLEGLPGLGVRYQALKEKDQHLMAQKKMSDGKKEEISQDEYKRGISSWTFDMDDLRSQASLGTECEDSTLCKDSDISFYDLDSLQDQAPEGSHLLRDFSTKYDADIENDMTTKDKSAVSSPDQPASLVRNASMRGMPINGSFRKDNSTESFDLECQEKHLDIVPTSSSPERKFSFSSCSSNGLLLSKESSKQQTSIHNLDKCNGGHLHVSDETSSEAAPKTHKSAEDHDDRSKPPLIRGRFRVIPGHVDSKAQPPGLQKCHSMQTISRLPSLSIPSSAEVASTIIGGSFYMQLYSILQTNMLQRDQILNAMKQVSGCAMASPGVPSMASPCIPSTSRSTSPSGVPSVDRSMLEAAQEREKELLNEVLELQWRVLQVIVHTR
ncbi:STE20/SPS1-related proline-alanine-rich protein kinase isoform X2 [Zea mays]|uniref:STE20/SPS1-related proline-alanine-rich protein kinase isoform X2 n=1 Tax=Zea mays TaxID=4577 RepID=UPI0004DEB5E1|nr:STE20/SPS1-related proline-alanine-rich protein kinase isoform X2 [Zea mays]XP_008677372.1 STE20/SPS1-related proline-alanine-rich protein kinase isoform X2 [Zea mays]|eukprot:XP_008677371.1 STE20/SPS1-related proline-alanine-rich protein kinase isoform X2 [Zea mays]